MCELSFFFFFGYVGTKERLLVANLALGVALGMVRADTLHVHSVMMCICVWISGGTGNGVDEQTD